jgi:CHAD domain-containing protein
VTERSELLKKRLTRLTRSFKSVESGDVIALHRSRVASRRLRELLPLLELPAARGRKIRRRLRKVTVRLGSVRELDVLMLLIDELHTARRQNRAALSQIAMTVSKERDESRKRLPRRLPKHHLRRATRKLRRVIDALTEAEQKSRHPAKAWRWALDARISQRASRLQVAMENAGTVYSPNRLHEVRIAVKKMRYTLELAADVSGSVTASDLRLLRRAQDLLGRLHDVELLVQRARQEQTSISPPNLAAWRGLDDLIAALEDDCRRLHARYSRLATDLNAVAEHFSAKRKGLDMSSSSRRAG